MTRFLRNVQLAALGLALIIGISGCGDKQEPADDQTAQPPAQAAPATGDEERAGPDSEAAGAVPARDGAVAVVNGAEISWLAYNREVALEQEFAQAMKQREAETDAEETVPDETFEKEALTNLINFELAYQDSQRINLQPSAEEIEQTLSLMKAGYTDEAEFEAALRQNKMTGDELKEQIRRSLAIKMWQEQEFVDKITVGDEEAEEFYRREPSYFMRPERIMVSHILINWPDEGDRQTVKEEARRKMAGIRKQALEGADFNQLALESSADPTVRDNKGNLGWITKGLTVEQFETAAFALETPGQISEIVETPFGFHVIKLEEKQPAGPEPFEEVKDWIKSRLTEEKIEQAVQERIAVLNSQAEVKILDTKLAEVMAANPGGGDGKK